MRLFKTVAFAILVLAITRPVPIAACWWARPHDHATPIHVVAIPSLSTSHGPNRESASPYHVVRHAAKPTVQLLTTAKGRTYRVIDTGEPSGFSEPAATPSLVAAAGSSDTFVGHDRKKAKTSIATAELESFATVADLLASLVPDATMRGLSPPISTSEDSDRVAQEKRNVSVKGFIYAVKFEGDHDFHVIVGTAPGSGTTRFLNVEVSGLPTGGADRPKLKEARDQFKSFFESREIRFGGSYKKFDPPLPVRIDGSLFFDVDHLAGVVGPAGMRPATAWEIHPVTRIEFDIDP